jgi:hypothetical protein
VISQRPLKSQRLLGWPATTAGDPAMTLTAAGAPALGVSVLCGAIGGAAWPPLAAARPPPAPAVTVTAFALVPRTGEPASWLALLAMPASLLP